MLGLSAHKVVTRPLVQALERICPGRVRTDINLAEISRWKIGGKADCILCPGSLSDLTKAIGFLNNERLPYIVVGSTTNLLFSDQGLRVFCIQIGDSLSGVEIHDQKVTAQAGVWVPEIARKLALAGLSGAEHICGIPGTLGGLVYMNGGSQRKSISEHITSVLAVSPNGEIKSYNQIDCDFEYRSSIFQQNNNVILEVRLEFPLVKDPGEIRREMLGILKSRRIKFPQKYPNCGSVFINHPTLYKDYGPPGAIIEKLGFKGMRKGGAEVSSVHANFINNVNNARAEDVLELIDQVRNAVFKKTGFYLEVEARYVQENGMIYSIDEFLDISSNQ